MDVESTFGTVTEGGTTNTIINTANSRIGISIGSTGSDDVNGFDLAFSAAKNDFWIHDVATQFNATTLKFLKLYESGTLRFGVGWSSTTQLTFYSWNGSIWTALLTTPINVVSTNTKYTFDMHVVLGNPGKVAMYVNGLVVAADAGLNLSAATNIDKARFQSTGNSSNQIHSEIIIADFVTIGSKIVSQAPDANGNYTAWTGVFTDIDETSGGTDTISTANVGDRESWSVGNFPTEAAGEVIVGFGIGISALRDASSPQNINIFQRIAGTDYDGADRTLNASTTNRQKLWELSPATSAAYTATELNGSESGVRART